MTALQAAPGTLCAVLYYLVDTSGHVDPEETFSEGFEHVTLPRPSR